MLDDAFLIVLQNPIYPMDVTSHTDIYVIKIYLILFSLYA